ncbi:MAG: glucosidase [Anaerolineae bacterium]
MTAPSTARTEEAHRLAAIQVGADAWQRWGTYLSDRAWGTVREDYSANGDAWAYFPFEHAHQRVYRWNEDGLAGFCDEKQTICLSLALWNEKDSILKERPFGLTNSQGNHGEDVKDYWFYLDNLPTHSYARMVYKYPQAAFPYADLVKVNGERSQLEPEYELFDALREEWLANRYFDVFVEYAKAGVEDILCRITVVNRGPDAAPIHVLPHLWYRNTWSWDEGQTRYSIEAAGSGRAVTTHPALGKRWYYAQTSGGGAGELLFCENETNFERLYGVANKTTFVKDGINDTVVHNASNAAGRERGSKMAAHFAKTLAPGETWVVQVRLSPRDLPQPFANFDQTFELRQQEADEFYNSIHAPHLTDDQKLVQRQALAGLLWCKQYYHYAVHRWLQGDPTQPSPPPERWHGRNANWQHIYNDDIILMPDAWEYPWYAAWDLTFHCVSMALIDPAFAKRQLQMIASASYQHPYGELPAYEWNFSDVNPPLLSWAGWQVYLLDLGRGGVPDLAFLETIYRSTVMVTGWWLNQKDKAGNGIFGGGFLGMDNIGVFNRDQPLPTGGTLEQTDGTAWMAMLALHMLEITVELARRDITYRDMLPRYLWDYVFISNVLQDGVGGLKLWDEDRQFYFDVIREPDGRSIPLEVFSINGLVPLYASIAVLNQHIAEVLALEDRYRQRIPELLANVQSREETGVHNHTLYAVVFGDRLRNVLKHVLDPAQFLSDYGVRAVSRYHQDHPYTFVVGGQEFSVEYWPNVSHNRMFGGNSNWRGPIWFPVNFLLVQAMNAYARFYGDTFKVEMPTGSGQMATLSEVGDELARRLTMIFVRDDKGRRAVFGDNATFQTDPHWRDYIPFYEYFDGDDGSGVGASHQTGWTATVALLLQYGGDLRFVDLSKYETPEQPQTPTLTPA